MKIMYNTEKLAYNIKKFRKIRGMTQTQLAGKLYMTSQNISKWELGLSVPDIEKLCAMAEIFEISIDRLLGLTENTDKKVLVAIDGGGTKTEFIMFTEQAEILSRLVLSGSNPNSCGIEKTFEVLKSGIDHMFETNMNITGIYAGIAGAASGDNRKKILKFLKNNYKNIKFDVQSDILNVIYSTGRCENCIAAICGTGSVVYAKCGDELSRLGGWGYLLEEGGSGYSIGRDVLRTALSQNDGITKRTPLSDVVEKRLGGNIWDNIDTIYSSGKDFIASFSTAAFEAYNSGDAEAGKIIEKNTDSLAFFINKASAQFPCADKVIFSGGVVQKNEVFRKSLLSKISGSFDTVLVDAPQIIGAGVNCCRLFADADDTFLNRLKENYKNFQEDKNA